MTPYRNTNRNSNIESYQIFEDSILVAFKSGKHRNYLYDHQTPGKLIVEQMKILAISGRGLNSYISSVVRARYSKKW